MSLGIEQKVGALVWSPMASGKLSGKYRRNQPPPPDARVAQGGSPVKYAVTDDARLYDIIDVFVRNRQNDGSDFIELAAAKTYGNQHHHRCKK